MTHKQKVDSVFAGVYRAGLCVCVLSTDMIKHRDSDPNRSAANSVHKHNYRQMKLTNRKGKKRRKCHIERKKKEICCEVANFPLA